MKRSIIHILICSIILCYFSCSIENDKYLNDENVSIERSVIAIKSRELVKKGDFIGVKSRVLKGKPLFFYSTVLKKTKTLNLVVAIENNDGYVDGYIDYTLDSLNIIKNEAIYDSQSLRSRTRNSLDNQVLIFQTLSSKGYKLNPIITKELEFDNRVKDLLNNSSSKFRTLNKKAGISTLQSPNLTTTALSLNSTGRQCSAYFRGHYILDFWANSTCSREDYYTIVERLDKHIELQIRGFLNEIGNFSFSINYGINGFYITGGELANLTSYEGADYFLRQCFSSFPLSMQCIREFRYVGLTGFGANCLDPNNPGGNTGGGGNTNVPPMLGDEGTGENPEVPDPDLPSNCDSWVYHSVAAGDYQVAGVTNLRFDYISEYMGTDGKMHISYYRGTFTRPLYFEFPRIRDNGDFISPEAAAKLTAQIKDEAERILDSQVNASPTPKTALQSDQMIDRFFNILKYQMQQYGGRVTKVNNYGNGVVVKPYSKTIIPCY